jgi:hypothetical protein
MRAKFQLSLSSLPRLAEALRRCGYEVNDQRVDWRVLMWRRDCKEWSQAYTGLTAKAKVERQALTIFGPEVAALDEVFD